jgi:hypothetical protein
VLATGDVGTNASGSDRDRLRDHPGLVRVGSGPLLEHFAEVPQVSCDQPLAVNLQRLADGRVTAHLVSYDHDDDQDRVPVHTDVRLDVRLRGALRQAQGTWSGPVTAELIAPGQEKTPLPVTSEGDSHTVTLPSVGAYGIVVFHPAGTTP